MVSARAVGDATNVVVLVLTVAYAVATVAHGAGLWNLTAFGEHWAADGFCLSFKDTKYHTHLLCFYGDTLFAVVTWALTRKSSRPELRVVKLNSPSCFFHGILHLFLWFGGTKGSAGLGGAPALALRFLFWVSFLFGIPTPFDAKVNVFQAIVHAFAAIVVPPVLRFTYVNTVLFLNINVASLLSGLEGERDIFYALSATIISAPIMMATWAEPLLCDSWLVNWGGHILFDFTIPTTTLIYLATASRLPPRKRNLVEKEA